MTHGRTIRLGQYLKLMNLVATGGEAKVLIQAGEVLVNGQVETRRKRRLVAGDRVTIHGQTYIVAIDDRQAPAAPGGSYEQ